MKRYLHTTALLLLASAAQARIDLVTLPQRDRTELTIYNSQDLTLVRETRNLSFRKGDNSIQFSWAGTKIDPTSLDIDTGKAPGLVLQDAVYPANTREMIVWNVTAEEAGSRPIEISYFLSGAAWSSTYTIVANADESQFELQQFTRVANNTGEDFENAHTRVVVGDVNLQETILEIIERWRPRSSSQTYLFNYEGTELSSRLGLEADNAPREAGAIALRGLAGGRIDELKKAKEILKKGVSEYQLYSVEGEEDIPTGWSKSLPNPRVADIPFDLSYEFDPRRYGSQVVKFYKLRNEDEAKLGKSPLPEGSFYVYRRDGRDGLAFEGSTTHKYIPIGEKIELNLGHDGLVELEQKVQERKRLNFSYDNGGNVSGWDEEVLQHLILTNGRDASVPMKLTTYLDAGSDVMTSSHKFEQVDRETVRWELPLPAASKTTIELRTMNHFGTNSKAN